MIDSLASKIAIGIKNSVPDHPASIARLKYSLSFILNASFIIVLGLIVSMITGRVSEAASALVAFALLRQVSGGIHLKSGTTCVVVSVVGITGLSFVSINDVTVVHMLTGVSVLAMLFFAPSGIEEQTRIPKKYFPLLKALAILIVSTNFVLGSSVVAATFVVQSITLILRKGVRSDEEKVNV